LAIAKSLWQLYLAVPSILLVPAVLLGIARKYFQVTALNSAYLKRYEATLRDAALEFQRYLPNPPSFPLFTIKELNMSTGDINIIKGDNNTQIVKSMVEGSFNQVKGKHGGDIDRFLEEVGKKVIESKNPQAAKLYEKFNSELIETPPTGSILKGIWDGLLKVLPAVGEIVGAAEAILKLTSD
jgi:hypothetical protein